MPYDLEPPVRWWHCPACDLRDRTQQAGVHTQFHNCPAVFGIGLPLVEVRGPDVKADARQRLVMREDYANGGDPRASVLTERFDGSNDVTVLAPTAGVKGESRV